MKPAALAVYACLWGMVLAASGCNYAKPVMYIDIANHSGHVMENIEVKHPTGIFGLPELRDEQTHRRMVPIGAPCTFKLEFEDQSGKKYAGASDLGAKSPTEIAFEIGSGMSISQRLVRP